MTPDQQKDLLLAILAMDSYNQGYDAGLQHGATTIGTAELKDRPESIKVSDWQAASFYAAAYSVGGEIVVSDRG
jgi:hypothetical protein